jgi:toxin-antitoxin system PIN domain toxin
MIVPDVNLLVYAHDSTSPQHQKAKKWWENLLSGSEPVGLPVLVGLAFVRLATHPTPNENPMTVAEARGRVGSWLETPVTQWLTVSPRTIEIAMDLLELAGRGGNLASDAFIGALSIEHGATVHSNDRDFARFPGVKWIDPLS